MQSNVSIVTQKDIKELERIFQKNLDESFDNEPKWFTDIQREYIDAKKEIQNGLDQFKVESTKAVPSLYSNETLQSRVRSAFNEGDVNSIKIDRTVNSLQELIQKFDNDIAIKNTFWGLAYQNHKITYLYALKKRHQKLIDDLMVYKKAQEEALKVKNHKSQGAHSKSIPTKENVENKTFDELIEIAESLGWSKERESIEGFIKHAKIMFEMFIQNPLVTIKKISSQDENEYKTLLKTLNLCKNYFINTAAMLEIECNTAQTNMNEKYKVLKNKIIELKNSLKKDYEILKKDDLYSSDDGKRKLIQAYRDLDQNFYKKKSAPSADTLDHKHNNTNVINLWISENKELNNAYVSLEKKYGIKCEMKMELFDEVNREINECSTLITDITAWHRPANTKKIKDIETEIARKDILIMLSKAINNNLSFWYAQTHWLWKSCASINGYKVPRGIQLMNEVLQSDFSDQEKLEKVIAIAQAREAVGCGFFAKRTQETTDVFYKLISGISPECICSDQIKKVLDNIFDKEKRHLTISGDISSISSININTPTRRSCL